MELPLNLQILRTVQEFGKLPLALLYQRIAASPTEIEGQVKKLASEGAVRIDGDYVVKMQ